MLHINASEDSVMSYLSNGAIFIVFGNQEDFKIDFNFFPSSDTLLPSEP